MLNLALPTMLLLMCIMIIGDVDPNNFEDGVITLLQLIGLLLSLIVFLVAASFLEEEK